MNFSKEVLNFKPKITEDFISYSRDERNGTFSFRFKNSISGEVLLNHTFEKVISKFNGENSISDVIKYIMEMYKDAPEDLVSKDVIDIVNKLIQWQGISWVGKNPFLNNKTYEIEKDTIICLSNYSEVENINDLVRDMKCNKDNYLVYANSLLADKDFNEETIFEALLGKQAIFNIKRNDKLCGAIIFENDGVSINILKFAIFNKEINDISKYINYAMSEVAKIPKMNTKCFRAHLIEDNDSVIKEALKKLDFNRIIILKDELGKGIDVEELSYFA